MKVLHILNEINYSGAEIMYANAAPLFQKEGYEQMAISTGKERGSFAHQFEKAGIEIYHHPLLNTGPFAMIKYFRNFYSFIKKEKIDVIHIHRASFFWFFAWCGYLASVKTIRTVHNVFRNRKITWIKGYLERFTARRFFNLTFQSISESVYYNELNYYKNPSVVVNNWYDPNRFFPPLSPNEKNEAKKNIGISENSFVVISTGSCTDIKNHVDIIKALFLVIKQISCVYLHLGTGCTEKEEKKLAADLGVQDYIHFLGNRINVRDYLIASDVFIMPSKFEGLGNAAIEAMACEVPCILYNVEGLKDLIKNDNNGFLIDQNHTLIAQKIIELSKNPFLKEMKGKNAFEYVAVNYNMHTSVSKIIELYKK